MRSESLSFTLRKVETHEDLLRACQVRAQAYGHKVPAYREQMATPDAIDASPWTSVFVCDDKASGRGDCAERGSGQRRGAAQRVHLELLRPGARTLHPW